MKEKQRERLTGGRVSSAGPRVGFESSFLMQLLLEREYEMSPKPDTSLSVLGNRINRYNMCIHTHIMHF